MKLFTHEAQHSQGNIQRVIKFKSHFEAAADLLGADVGGFLLHRNPRIAKAFTEDKEMVQNLWMENVNSHAYRFFKNNFCKTISVLSPFRR